MERWMVQRLDCSLARSTTLAWLAPKVPMEPSVVSVRSTELISKERLTTLERLLEFRMASILAPVITLVASSITQVSFHLTVVRSTSTEKAWSLTTLGSSKQPTVSVTVPFMPMRLPTTLKSTTREPLMLVRVLVLESRFKSVLKQETFNPHRSPTVVRSSERATLSLMLASACSTVLMVARHSMETSSTVERSLLNLQQQFWLKTAFSLMAT